MLRWMQVLTQSYTVYLPENSDGLVFAAEAQPDSYNDVAPRMELDSIDPYSGLYFSLCY